MTNFKTTAVPFIIEIEQLQLESYDVKVFNKY